MKLLFHANTATTATAAIVFLPALASGYNMGGGFMFGRPIYITPNTVGRYVAPPSSSSCKQQQRNWVDNAFETLESEMNENGFSPGPFRRGDRRRRGGSADVNIDKETVEAMRKQQAQQQELFNKALDLANDVVNGIARDASVASPKDTEVLKQQQKMWFNRAFGIASDVVSGRSSPRYEINNNDEKFQVEIDVPGVKPSDIDIRLVDDERSGNSNDKVLIITGQRKSSISGAIPIEFKKEFFVDASVIDVDSITAQINNGVLVVTATKVVPSKKEPLQKKIPVMQVTSDDQAAVSVTDDSVADKDDADVPSKTVEANSTAGNEEEESA